MDEDDINNLIQSCKLLKYKFHDVFAADNFPVNLSHNSFIIVNVSTSQSIGTYWTLFYRRKGKYIFADPLGQNLASYKHLHNKLASSADNIQTVFELLRYQPNSKTKLFIVWLILYLYCSLFFGEKEIVKMSDVD